MNQFNIAGMTFNTYPLKKNSAITNNSPSKLSRSLSSSLHLSLQIANKELDKGY